MTEAVDMIKLVKKLPSRPRGRACIVLTHDYGGQKDWAFELAKLTGMDHIDLLDLFENEKDLSQNISSFQVADLFGLLTGESSASVLIVTGIEFLTASWAGQSGAFEQFAGQIEMWSKSPALLFVMQFDSFLAKRKFIRFPQYTFVIDQKETFALT